jgi:hypothetical protein
MPRLSGPGQVRVVGLPSWWLEQAGLVSWEDLFEGDGAVRHFDLVVRRKHLTVEQLLGAGIPEAIARRAVGPDPFGR